MRFQFIAAEKAHHSLSLLCRCLRVTRSGFYAWQRRPESAHAKRDRQLKVLVRASFDASKRRLRQPAHSRGPARAGGAREPEAGHSADAGGKLQARQRKRFKCTTMSDHDLPVGGESARPAVHGGPRRTGAGSATPPSS